ncbi:MAG: GAF domain-containing protein [Actinobacteria bacterium]|nr:GAF domain-containing protein [Actinomycetota bacterium]
MTSSQWVAINSSTDRREWARKLARAHERGLAGATAQPEVREVIDQSWQRSARARVDPIGGIAPLVMSEDEAAARWEDSPLRVAEPILRELLADVGTAGQQVVLVCDAEGTMLWIDGEPGVLEQATAIHLERGSGWSEERAGTNAMGTALAAGHPLQVFSAEHFAVPVHEWTCSAAPVRDPETGETIGVLDLSGELGTAHPHSLALVAAAARMIEAELARSAAERAAALQERHGMRRQGGGAAELHTSFLGRDGALVEAGGRRVHLSPRHSEILCLLSLMPEGMGAERLALELYGDFGKPVTARAELSRLRRVLPGAIVANPYRLGIKLRDDRREVEKLLGAGRLAEALGRYTGPLLPGSEAPLVEEARRRLDDGLREAILASGAPALIEAWLRNPSGEDDLEACRALVARLAGDDPRRPAAISRLRRLLSPAR